MTTTKDTTPKKAKIHIGKNGGVRVDAKEFFQQEGVKKRIASLSGIDIVGKTLKGKYPPAETSNK